MSIKNVVLGKARTINANLTKQVIRVQENTPRVWDVDLFDDKTGRIERTLFSGKLEQVGDFLQGMIERYHLE